MGSWRRFCFCSLERGSLKCHSVHTSHRHSAESNKGIASDEVGVLLVFGPVGVTMEQRERGYGEVR